MDLGLQGEAFSASVGALIKSNTRLEIALGLRGSVHAGEQPRTTGVSLLQSLATPARGFEGQA